MTSLLQEYLKLKQEKGSIIGTAWKHNLGMGIFRVYKVSENILYYTYNNTNYLRETKFKTFKKFIALHCTRIQ